jgi:hypothetical protein
MTSQVSDVAISKSFAIGVDPRRLVVLLQSGGTGADGEHGGEFNVTAIAETLLFMLAVLAAAAIVAQRLNRTVHCIGHRGRRHGSGS